MLDDPHYLPKSTALPNSNGRAKLVLSLIALLAIIGLGLAAYLTWTTWNASSVAGCGGEGLVDCDHVLASRWSKWIGVPVSLFGAITYVGILTTCGIVASRSQGTVKTALLTLSLLAAGSATWFVGLQVVILQSFCLYCMGAHVCSLVICGLTVFFLQSTSRVSPEDPMRTLFGVADVSDSPSAQMQSFAAGEVHHPFAIGIAALGLLLLMGGQFFHEPPGMVIEAGESPSPLDSSVVEAAAAHRLGTKEEADENLRQLDVLGEAQDTRATSSEAVGSREPVQRFMQFTGLKKSIDVSSMPILGSSQAKYVLVEMLDYTCHHCRHLHPYVHTALQRYGDQIAFVVLHVPLSSKCNPHVQHEHKSHKNACEYARLALNIWKLDREKFAEYHNWLMESEKPPTLSAAKTHALRLVGKEVLLDQTLAADSLRNVAGNSDDFTELQAGLPIILSEHSKLIGIPKSESEWFEFLEELLPIQPLVEVLD